jgi:hypothetical protein
VVYAYVGFEGKPLSKFVAVGAEEQRVVLHTTVLYSAAPTRTQRVFFAMLAELTRRGMVSLMPITI